MFWRKQAEIDRLKEIIAGLVEECNKLSRRAQENAVERVKLGHQLDKFAKESHYDSARAAKLTADLRQMDQLIYKMGQCSNWIDMQEVFQELQALCEARMREESDRIRGMLVPAIVETYTNADTKSLEASPVQEPTTPRLAGPGDANEPS